MNTYFYGKMPGGRCPILSHKEGVFTAFSGETFCCADFERLEPIPFLPQLQTMHARLAAYEVHEAESGKVVGDVLKRAPTEEEVGAVLDAEWVLEIEGIWIIVASEEVIDRCDTESVTHSYAFRESPLHPIPIPKPSPLAAMITKLQAAIDDAKGLLGGAGKWRAIKAL